jgi:hypothetical protein
VTTTAPDVLDDIERLANLRLDVDKMLVKAVRDARRRGVSWYKIGPALGVTRQAAMEKYKPKLANGKR